MSCNVCDQVSYLLKPFISYAGDNHNVTKPRDDIPRYASSDQLKASAATSSEGSADTSSSANHSSNNKNAKSKSGKKVN